MQNGNQKNEASKSDTTEKIYEKQLDKSDITDKIYKRDEYGKVEELKSLRDAFVSVYNRMPDESNPKPDESNPKPDENNPKQAPCFFLKAVDMYILSNIPNFIGLNIAIGFDKQKKDDVLIVLPVIRGSAINVTEQKYNVNGEDKKSSTVIILDSATSRGPCPPNPVGCCNCGCTPNCR
ncbi:MAG TPA: hypothetical protein VH396_01295 [Chitinophagaceae bacterium]|jgi:hypothetical protein